MSLQARCYAVCYSDSCDIEKAKARFQPDAIRVSNIEQALYVCLPSKFRNKPIEFFIFCFGSIVVWEAQPEEEKYILDQLIELDGECMPSVDFTHEEIQFKYDPEVQKSFVNEAQDCVIANSDNIFTKFSISYALAQSVKLSFLETSIERLLKSTSTIQKELSVSGSTSLSKKEISKKIGELFSQRYSTNLHNDVLDMPEFFWNRPFYEELYMIAARSQDIQPRQNTLNRRLDMIHDLYEVLSHDLEYKQSARLEMVIIVLITIEVILSIVHLILK